MKKIFCFLALLFSCNSAYADKFTTTKVSSCASAEISFENSSGPKGGVLRTNCLRPLYSYTFYRPDGSIGASGFPLFFPTPPFGWSMIMDIDDKNQDTLGKIQGQFSTEGTAAFFFFDRQNNVVAYAYLESDGRSFKIVSPTDTSIVLGSITAHPGASPYWDVYIEPNLPFDKRIVKVFTGFAIDFDNCFDQNNVSVEGKPPIPCKCR